MGTLHTIKRMLMESWNIKLEPLATVEAQNIFRRHTPKPLAILFVDFDRQTWIEAIELDTRRTALEYMPLSRLFDE